MANNTLQDDFKSHQFGGTALIAVFGGVFAIQLVYNTWYRTSKGRNAVVKELAAINILASLVAILAGFIPIVDSSWCHYNLALEIFYENAANQIYLDRVACVFYLHDVTVKKRLTVALIVYYLALMTGGAWYAISNTGLIAEPNDRSEMACVLLLESQSGTVRTISLVISGLLTAAVIASSMYMLAKGVFGFYEFFQSTKQIQSTSNTFVVLKLVFAKKFLDLLLVSFDGVSIFLSLNAELGQFTFRLFTHVMSLGLSLFILLKVYFKVKAAKTVQVTRLVKTPVKGTAAATNQAGAT
uniref:Uncharacterized protein n=1 Tax=Spongospora subterranea TaxID=70186 RepID=A0A0H5QRW3_9EUKA|eukprot:CRZ04744.1 hypothetical protein [Spongospora subterranea]